jgi:GT2 family glycosyltransferase
MPSDNSEIKIWKKVLAIIAPYNSKRRVFIKMAVQIIARPRQLAYYCRPQKIIRVFYYLKHGGITKVSQILDERLLMGSDLKLEIHTDKIIESSDIADYKQLIFPIYANPIVSIIIPAYNQFSYTYACLNSILKNSGNIAYEIIVADDCSSDLTIQLNAIALNIRIVRTPQNYGFLKNCNYAAAFSQGTYLLLLNNDTQVQPGWLAPMIQLLGDNQNIGMTGSKLVYPDGRLQEAGGILWKDGSAWNYGNGSNPALPEFSYVKECDYISGASIMIRTTLWKQLGGFDERFTPAYCEDSDLAFMVRKAGYKVCCQPLSVVIHYEGVSNGVSISEGLKAYQRINQSKFYEKWKNELEKNHKPNGEDVFLVRDRSQLKKRILVIDHMVPQYDKDAGARNVFMYTKIFIESGLKVTFLPADYYPYQPYTAQLEQLGVEVLYGNYYFKYWKEWIQENAHFFDYFYVNRPHIAARYIDLLKQYGNGKLIYYGHDLHYLRERREYEVTGNKELLKSSEHWKILEYQLIEKSDIIYVPSTYEKTVLEQAFPEKVIRSIPIYIYEKMDTKKCPNIKKKKNLLFVGGFGHPPNIDAVLWFANEIFPHILISYPDIIWYIVGSKPPQEIMNLQSNNIVIKGFVSDEELHSLYQSCRLVVVPLRYGAGVKGKVIESIYEQCPLITTPVGAEGISTLEGVFVVAAADKSMADTIIQLYNDEDVLQNMMSKSPEYINTYFTKKQVIDVLGLDIGISDQKYN